MLVDLFNSKEVVELIDSQNPSFDRDDSSSLIYLNLFPFLQIPGTESKADCYVLLSVDKVNINSYNKIHHDIRITIWCLCHKERMKVKSKNGTRIDLLANEIERLLGGQLKYGFNKLELTASREMILDPTYLYRELIFMTSDRIYPVS